MKKLTAKEYQVWCLLHRQSRKDLRRQRHRNGGIKYKHRMRTDLLNRLKRQTGYRHSELIFLLKSLREKVVET